MSKGPGLGLLFNIQRSSIHDGPGMRTVLFFKGCPLNCVWCQNPESQSRAIESMVTVGPDGQEERVTVGSYYTPGQVLTEIEKDRVYYEETGGGVTFSGGEPTLQPSFLTDLVYLCKAKNIHTTLETCGYFHYDALIETLFKIDLIYFDIKIIHAEHHKDTRRS